MNRADSAPRVLLWLSALLLATAIAYWPGMFGPFMFDDDPNLTPVLQWLRGELSGPTVLLGNAAGPGGRIVTMASFMANAAAFGLDPWSFKLVNLALHLGNGLLLYRLLRALYRGDRQLGGVAEVAALAGTGLWLLHPLQVSTVLYVVQRMTELSALFVLSALLAYLDARRRLEAGTAGGRWRLWLLVPVLIGVGILCKETAALAVPMLTLIEWVVFARRPAGPPRPRGVAAFHALFLGAPALLGTLFLLAGSRWLAEHYDEYDFTLGERLLTEPRVVVDYLRQFLLPQPGRMGLLHDDFALSHGLLTAPSPLPELILLAGLVLLAVACRRRLPLLTVGIGVFFIGHALEGSIVPLDLYFEHRNYLPSAGLVLALTALVGQVRTSLAGAELRLLRLAPWLGAVILAILALTTWSRAQAWGSAAGFYADMERSHPESRRMHLQAMAYRRSTGQVTLADEHLQWLLDSADAQNRALGAVRSVIDSCKQRRPIVDEQWEALRAPAGMRIGVNLQIAWEDLVVLMEGNQCGDIDAPRVAGQLASLVESSPQSPRTAAIWRLRFVLARALIQAKQAPEALDALVRSFDDGNDFFVGAYLFRIWIAASQCDRAAAVYTRMQALAGPAWSNPHKVAFLQQARGEFAAATQCAGRTLASR